MSGTDSAPPPAFEPALEYKVRFLQRADTYANGTTAVETVETHFAYVFLTRRLAYKLKKPIRFHSIDYRTLAARRASAQTELRLNRRLAERVYIDAVPLSAGERGLALEAPDRDGGVVDWLVKMHRLPRRQMLDARLAAGEIADRELHALVARLCAFYDGARRADWDGPAYRRRLERQLDAMGAELASRARLLDEASASRLVDAQRAFLAEQPASVEDRCVQGRVVDAHGDLRPEHVLLDEDPQIIDCLEFSTELRLLDTAEEIAFLALECAQLGRADVAERVVTLYRALCRDDVPPPLLDFYTSRRALGRALSCAWHLDEPLAGDLRAHWVARTRRYVDVGLAAMARARGRA